MVHFASHAPHGLVDEPITAVLQDASPNQPLLVEISTIDHQQRRWSRTLDVHADDSGRVDLTQASQADDGLGYDPHGLIHQLTPDEPARWTNQISFTLRPITILLEVRDPSTGDLLTATEFVRFFAGPDVTRHEWRTNTTTANLYKPNQTQDSRAIIVIPGAWGGFDWCNQIAALIAARRRPALALPYFDWRTEYGLPRGIEHIPLEYAQTAARRLHAEPGIDPNWTSVIGMSKGAEFALAWASHDPSIDELIALSPTLYAWESVRKGGTPPARSSWTFRGEPLPFLHFDADEEFYETLDKTLLQKFHEKAVEEAPHDTPARLSVERIKARTLLISQESDTLWPAPLMGNEIVEAMRQSTTDTQVEHHIVLGRGHAMFAAGVPANNVDASARINGLAQTAIWSHIREFLQV